MMERMNDGWNERWKDRGGESGRGARAGNDTEINKFDTNKDASNICENERIFLNFHEFT